MRLHEEVMRRMGGAKKVIAALAKAVTDARMEQGMSQVGLSDLAHIPLKVIVGFEGEDPACVDEDTALGLLGVLGVSLDRAIALPSLSSADRARWKSYMKESGARNLSKGVDPEEELNLFIRFEVVRELSELSEVPEPIIRYVPAVSVTEMPDQVRQYLDDMDIPTHCDHSLIDVEDDGNPLSDWLKANGYVFGEHSVDWVAIWAT